MLDDDIGARFERYCLAERRFYLAGDVEEVENRLIAVVELYDIGFFWCNQADIFLYLGHYAGVVDVDVLDSAQTESAMAGALGVRLGGPAFYFGNVS